MENERSRPEEALRNTTSYVPQPLLEAHAPPKKDWKAKNGHWTKREVEHFHKRLEGLFQQQNECEKQAPTSASNLVNNVGKVATVENSQQSREKQHFPSVTSFNTKVPRALIDPQGDNPRAIDPSLALTKIPGPDVRDQQLSGQFSAGAQNNHNCRTELAPTSQPSKRSGSSANAFTNSIASASGLTTDADRTQTQHHMFLHQQTHDLPAREEREEQRRRLVARLEAVTKAHVSRKATAELQQITKGMQKLRISHVGGELATPPVRPDPQVQQVNTAFTALNPTSKSVIFATKRSHFVSDPPMKDNNHPGGTIAPKNPEEVNHGQTPRDTSSCRDAQTTRTIEEVDRARQMQELREQFFHGRMLTPDALAPPTSGPKDNQKNNADSTFFKDRKSTTSHTMSRKNHLARHPIDNSANRRPAGSHASKRVHFHPIGVPSVPEPLELGPTPTTASADEVNMDLYRPPTPHSASLSDGVFTDISLSFHLHSGFENDFVEVDVSEVDALEWEVING